MNELDAAVLRKAGQMVQESDAAMERIVRRRDELARINDKLTEALRLIAIRTSDPWAMGMADAALETARSAK